MKRIFLILFIFTYFLYSQTNQPSIGYVYPAGGRIGTSFEIIVGGQNLRGVKDIYFSTDMIKVESFIYIPILSPQQRQLLSNKIRDILRSRYEKNYVPKEKPKQEEIKLPENPLLTNLENKNVAELKKIVEIFLTPFRREQIKRSIQEKVLIKVNISPDIKPGIYELRVLCNPGITNPLRFFVSNVPEVKEDFEIPFLDFLKEENEVYEPPIIINGQITPGDIDRYYFKCKKGEKIIIELKAREIIPYMADAVPGWFQANLTLYDSNGKEIKYSDDYYFNPDPLIFFEVPEDGVYSVKVKDALYRGREDFVYRLYIGKEKTEKKLNIDEFIPGGLKEVFERENNDKLKNANEIKINQLIKGKIDKEGDIDIFKIKLKKNLKIVAEVYGRRFGSPVDAYVCIMDSKGKILTSNDDYYDRNFDYLTHHADSYILWEVPDDGLYYIKVLDIQRHGGDDYFYYLRVSEPFPDFSIFVVPSSINIFSTNTTYFYVYAFRKDGFDGEIKLSLKNGPKGIILNAGRVPPFKDKIAVTLTATEDYIPSEKPVSIQIEGTAIIEGYEVKKIAKPADEMMQAFAYFHLIPSNDLLLYTRRWRFSQIPFKILNENEILKIPSGGKAKVEYKILQPVKNEKINLELKEPKEGIKIENLKIENDILSFDIKLDEKINKGYSDNLIIEIISEIGGKRISMGFLPAIMIEVI